MKSRLFTNDAFTHPPHVLLAKNPHGLRSHHHTVVCALQLADELADRTNAVCVNEPVVWNQWAKVA